MDDNNFWVKLDKIWFYNGEDKTLLEEYSSIGFTVYSLLQRTVTTRNTISICVNAISDTILGENKINNKKNKTNNSRFVDKIKQTIVKMNDKLFIICSDSNCNKPIDIKKLNNNNTYYALINAELLKDGFMMIYDNEIDMLIDYAKGKKISASDLIVHYCFICNGFKGKKKEEEAPEDYRCYYGSFEKITGKIGLLKNNLITNNKIFVDLKLLLIDNPGAKINDKDGFENTSNIYAKVEDKEYFNKYLEIRKNKVKKSYTNRTEKESQDEQRRLKMLYKNFQKKNHIKNINDIETIEIFNELQKMELGYLNFAISRGKKAKNLTKTYYKTIECDGTPYKFYDTKDKLEDIENETPQGYKEEESWEGNEEDPFDDNKNDNEEDAAHDFVRDKLFEYVKENYNRVNKTIKKIFSTRFNEVDFKNLKDVEISDMTKKVKAFFNEYASIEEKKDKLIRDSLAKYINISINRNENVKSKFKERFKGIDFDNLTGENLYETKTRIEAFFTDIRMINF